MNGGRWGTVVALGLAVFSSGLAVFLFFESRAQRVESDRIRMSLLELQEAVERVAALKPTPDRASGAVAELEARLRGASSRAESGSGEVKPPDQPEILRGLRSLAQRPELDPDEVTEKQEILSDVTLSDRKRLRALRDLRSQPRDSNPYSPRVVASLIDWMDGTESPEVRARIIRDLHRGEVGELQQPILDYLRTDPDPNVREEAADTLNYSRDDPSVRAALKEASERDPDESVRKQAGRTLEKLERRSRS